MAESVEYNVEGNDLDAEVLITLVEERPVLWNKALESFKSKMETSSAWRDVCRIMNPNDQLPEVERNKYGKLILYSFTIK